MLKIHVLYEHSGDSAPHGVSHIRLLLPLTYPTNAHYFEVSRGATYTEADIVIVDRMWKPETISINQAQALVTSIRNNRVRFIYSIDDIGEMRF